MTGDPTVQDSSASDKGCGERTDPLVHGGSEEFWGVRTEKEFSDRNSSRYCTSNFFSC